MNVFFDVDGTLICGHDGTLRPFALDVLAATAADGHRVYVWSGLGPRWDDLARHGLVAYVTACFTKPTTDHRRALAALRVDVEPEFVVDDHKDVVTAFGGYAVKSYDSYDPFDTDLLRALEAIRRFASARAQGDRTG